MTGSSPTERAESRYPAALSRVLAAATFAIVLDLAGVVIVIPSIQSELHATISEATWLIAAFVIAAATMIPLGARLTSRFGSRRMLLIGVGAFGLASIAAAVSPTSALLIAARAVQGIGAALIEPAVRTLLQTTLTGVHAKRATQAQALAALLAAALGPVLPAALATLLSWRALFSLDALLAAAILATALHTVPAGSPRGHGLHGPCRDLLITVLGAVAATGLFFALVEGPQRGWMAASIIGAMALVILIAIIALDWRRPSPLVRLSLFRRRRYVVGNALRALTEFASLGVFFPVSGYLQIHLGHSPLTAGLLLMPIILGALITAPLAEKYGDRLDARWFLIPGFLWTAIGIGWLAHITPDTPWWFFLTPLAVIGAGIGAIETPADRAIDEATPRNAAEPGWQLSRTVYLWGIGAGVASVSAASQVAGTSTPAGVNTALFVCAISALVGAAAATMLPSAHRSRPKTG